jgi:hypothetical protein
VVVLPDLTTRGSLQALNLPIDAPSHPRAVAEVDGLTALTGQSKDFSFCFPPATQPL